MKHLSFSSKLFAILFVFSSLIYVGCHKDDVKELDSASPVSNQLRTVVTPTVENGTLKFETEDDAYNYMRHLEQELKNESNTVLSEQNANGFTSKLATINNLEDGDPNGSIFNAPYLNAMLNSNYEIIIGDRVYTQKNHEETWIASKTDAQALAVFRSKQPGSFINDTEITSNMIIDGKKEVEAMMTCCRRFGKIPSSQTRTHNGATIRLGGEVEIVKGKAWGIYVHARADAKRNGTKTDLFNLEANAYGKFRDSECTVKYTDSDQDWCRTCDKEDVSIFHYKRSRDRFNQNEVWGKLKLYLGTPGQFMWVDLYPPCS